MSRLKLFGVPVFGFVLPAIRLTKIPLTRQMEIVDTGLVDMADEVGYYFVRLIAFEWLGFGIPIWQFDSGQLRLWSTGELVSVDHQVNEFDNRGE
jgi:hypothetical protein